MLFTINRGVRTRTLEGDGGKPLRHDNEGPTPYTFFLFLIYDGRKPKARIAEIVKLYSFENLQNLLKARNTSFCVVVVSSLFSSVERESDIGDRKLESWTLGILEDCRVLDFVCDVEDPFGILPKYDAL